MSAQGCFGPPDVVGGAALAQTDYSFEGGQRCAGVRPGVRSSPLHPGQGAEQAKAIRG